MKRRNSNLAIKWFKKEYTKSCVIRNLPGFICF